jgi:hypothetical protein
MRNDDGTAGSDGAAGTTRIVVWIREIISVLTAAAGLVTAVVTLVVAFNKR